MRVYSANTHMPSIIFYHPLIWGTWNFMSFLSYHTKRHYSSFAGFHLELALARDMICFGRTVQYSLYFGIHESVLLIVLKWLNPGLKSIVPFALIRYTPFLDALTTVF